jgi:NADH:ubiquinone oxidoreductase subunit F (NADH-binding)
VETLARVALLARFGPFSYEPTMLVTVATAQSRIVLEVPSGRSIGSVVNGALRGGVHAVLTGGFGGRWRAGPQLAALPIGPGHGVGILLPLRPDTCGLAATADVLAYLSAARARRCGPCTFGLPAIAEQFAGVSRAGSARRARAARRGLDELPALFEEVAGRGACHHPDGAVELAASALTAFAIDVAEHRRGRCLHADAQPGGFFPVDVSPG